MYSLCRSLRLLFRVGEGKLVGDVLEELDNCTASAPSDRRRLTYLEGRLSVLKQSPQADLGGTPPSEWQPGYEVTFRGRDYRIVERLGSGGQGTTFKVEAVAESAGEVLGHYVAKTIRHQEDGLRVLRSHMLARPVVGRHGSLSTILEVADEWHANEIVALMTWVDGYPLSDLIGQFPPATASGRPESIALKWLVDLCEALRRLHGSNLVHGDVSPRNVLVCNDSPVLTDFDLVTTSGKSPLSPGTPQYCSPTRQQGGPATPSDDVYALASTFLHVLHGRPPFASPSAEGRQLGLDSSGADDDRFPAVTRFLKKATDPDSGNRFRNADEALRFLRRMEAGHELGATQAETHDRARTGSGPTRPPNQPPSEGLDYSSARDRLVHWLRTQLIGPAAGADEILVGSSPLDRYPTGVLHPIDASGAGLDPAGAQSLSAPEGGDLEDAEDELVADGEKQGAKLGQAARRRRYVPPSSVGFSIFVRGNVRLEILVAAARYDPHPGRESTGWFRQWDYERSPVPEEVFVWDDETPIENPETAPYEVSVRKRMLADGCILTVTLANRRQIGMDEFGLARIRAMVAKALFQARLRCHIRSGKLLEYPRVDRTLLTAEEREIELQYRDRAIYAVGHGAAVGWKVDGPDDPKIWSDFMPSVEVRRVRTSARPTDRGALDLHRLATEPPDRFIPDLEAFVEGYEQWVNSQDVDRYAEHDRADAERIRQRMIEARERMSSGVSLIGRDSCVAEAFQIANRAMLDQMRQADVAAGKKPRKHRWRPFQLAFLLTAIESSVSEDDGYRDVLDLIWFPTGGGKTEAYLGLVAFLVVWRRLRFGPAGGGTVALMRYTLRLLTSQQFERAARMVFALELLRRQNPERLGMEPITVGMWVGGASSPNRIDDARKCVDRMIAGMSPPAGLVLAECPWCTADFDASDYRATHQTFDFRCGNRDCEFGGSDDPVLPCNVVDEALYDKPPSLLIGTIDKFARLAWEGRATSFFGKDVRRAPELVIQDELHLITGPLGSVAGLYEAGLETLLRSRGVRPKYIASTATIRMAQEQVRRLYGRPLRVFPPPGLTCDDSYFARTDYEQPGRLYIGYMAPRLNKNHCLAPVAGALLAAPETVFAEDAERQDLMEAWWTQVAYHTSLANVGSSHTAYSVEVRDWVRDILRLRQPDDHRDSDDGGSSASASQGDSVRVSRDRIAQITSLKSPKENAETFARLARRREEDGCLDVVLATSMVSVGLDVDRLAVMIMNGQPLTTAEYIQASSRVGRSEVPGIIVANYHRAQASSLFHYENFHSYHESFYRFVEAASVTPFTYQVRSRALHAALVLAIRHACPKLRENQDAIRFDPGSTVVRRVVETLKLRCAAAEEAEGPSPTAAHIERLVDEWQNEARHYTAINRGLKYDAGKDKAYDSLLVGFERRVQAKSKGVWPTLNSMRDVERTAALEAV